MALPRAGEAVAAASGSEIAGTLAVWRLSGNRDIVWYVDRSDALCVCVERDLL